MQHNFEIRNANFECEDTTNSQFAIRNSQFICAALFLIVVLTSLPANAQLFPRARPDSGPLPKNISGVVQDARGAPLAGARVFVRDMSTNIVRTLTTDQTGRYSIFGLPPATNYEVYAELLGKESEKRLISSFLTRQDNVLNFQIDVAVIEDAGDDVGGPAGAGNDGLSFDSFDLVRLHGSFELPQAVPAPIPSVVLLHGYGEDRSVWNAFKQQLLNRGWGVLTVDLRGHGNSRTRNQRPIEASTEWRTSSHEFPLDLDPTLDWLKSQPRVDSNKIVVIGFDVGANLALIASSKFPEVRTVVAIQPNLAESLAMAGSAQDFHPRSALLIVEDQEEGNQLRTHVAAPARILNAPAAERTAQSVAQTEIAEAIFQWLMDTY